MLNKHVFSIICTLVLVSTITSTIVAVNFNTLSSAEKVRIPMNCSNSRNGSCNLKSLSGTTHWVAPSPPEECTITQLTIEQPDTIDVSLIEGCLKLESITFLGTDYDCNDTAWMTLFEFIFLNRPAMDLRAFDTSCSSLDNRKCDYSNFILQILCLDAEEKCNGTGCDCFVRPETRTLREEADPKKQKHYNFFSVEVNCELQNLTNGRLPPPDKMPFRTSIISMGNNLLTNVDDWLGEVLLKLHFVERIDFSDNNLEKLPVLPINPMTKTRNPIKFISVDRNKRQIELDVTAFDSYQAYYIPNQIDSIVISTKGTYWTCNCETQKFNKFLMNHFNMFNNFAIFCVDGNGIMERPWTRDYGKCPKDLEYDYVLLAILTLGLANIIVIVIAVDLTITIVRNKKGLSNTRPPLFHLIWIKMVARIRDPCPVY